MRGRAPRARGEPPHTFPPPTHPASLDSLPPPPAAFQDLIDWLILINRPVIGQRARERPLLIPAGLRLPAFIVKITARLLQGDSRKLNNS